MSTGIKIAPSSDITVGTTAVTSGTDTRVFFQAGGVVQQDANFVWDNTNKRLGIGTTPSVELDVNGRFNFYQTNNGKGRLSLINNTGTGNFLTFTYTAVGYPGTSMFNAGVGFNFVGGNNYHGEITLARTAPSGLITTRIGASNDSYLSESNLVIGATTAGARLDVRAQGALSTDIAFRVRNSADTADLISFRGDGSEWIQSVPFRHAATSTGTNNANQGILLGYNVASLSTTSLNCVVIGRGSGAILQGNGNTIIGDGFTQGTFSNSIGLGRGVFVGNSNHFFCGSDSFPVNTWWVSTGGEASSGANLRGLDFRVSGMAGGPGNISAAAHPVRFFSPNGTGNGAGSNIQFHVAPSNTGGTFFNRNIFSEMFTIRGEADGLNHYQLSTPRVPSASITDGYIQYSNDITAGNAAPHFRTENGAIVKVYQETTAVTAAAFVSNTSLIVDDSATYGGYTMGQVVAALKAQGLLA